MPIARTLGVALTGLTGQIVEVQADLSAGLPGLTFTGLPDTSVVEARDRIRAAVLNSGSTWPNRRITLALLPADVRKAGSRFDLAMAIAILAAAGRVAAEAIADVVWIAELGLDGCLCSVRGVLSAMIAARRAGVRRVVVPSANAAEATLVDAVDVRAADSLAQVLDWLQGAGPPLPAAQPGPECPDDDRLPDLADIAGQSSAKRALEVSAAGGHNLYLVGAAGAGKTMLAVGLARKAVEAGYRTYYFTTAADLTARCHRAAIEGRWATTMRFYAGPTLLVIDELGDLPLPAAAASEIGRA